MGKYPNAFKQSKKTREQELTETMQFLKKRDKGLYDLALDLTLGVFDRLCVRADKK